jgi:hypothetical protein
MLFMDIIAVYLENHINTVSGHNADTLYVKAGGSSLQGLTF